MISLKKILLKTKTNRNNRIEKNIVRCMGNLGIKGRVSPLAGSHKKEAVFEVFLESCDEKQIQLDILHLNGRLLTEEYMYPLIDYSIVFNNSLGIEKLENHCELIFNDIKEMTTIKPVKRHKNLLREIFVDPYITIYSFIFKRKLLHRKALDLKYYKHSLRMLCIDKLSIEYDLKYLESAEFLAKYQIGHKKVTPAFWQVIILLFPYIFLMIYVIFITSFFTVFDGKTLAIISGSIIILRFKDEAFRLYENFNMVSISFEETDLFIIQEAIKKKKIYLDENKEDQITS
jgi:hypothetical protein